MSVEKDIFEGYFGLERETFRVDGANRFASSPHTFRDDHLSRDFCENQLEIITPVCESVEDAVASLGALDAKARKTLKPRGEDLWIYSNPPRFETEQDITIAQYKGDQAFRLEYRKQLEKRYGKRVMLYSGVHFNFSFREEFLRRRFKKSGAKDYREFRDALYLSLYKKLCRLSWLPVVLTAASPVCDRSFWKDKASGVDFSGFASLRNSVHGYWNKFVPVLDYSSLEGYIKSLDAYLKRGLLLSPWELYIPVRIKARAENSLENLAKSGIDHIELRMFDLNPFEKLGVNIKDLKFAHLLIVYLLDQKDTTFGRAAQIKAAENHKNAARYNLSEVFIGKKNIRDAALEVLDRMEKHFSAFPEAPTVNDIIAYEREKLLGRRLCEKVREAVGSDYDSVAGLRRG